MFPFNSTLIGDVCRQCNLRKTVKEELDMVAFKLNQAMEMIKTLSEEKENAFRFNEEYKEQMDTAMELMKEFREAKEKAEQERDRMKKEFDKAMNLVNNISIEKDKAFRERDESMKHLEKALKTVNLLTSEIENFVSQLDEKESALSDAQNGLVAINLDIDEMNKVGEGLKVELARKKRELQEKTQALTEAKLELNTLSSLLNQTDRNVSYDQAAKFETIKRVQFDHRKECEKFKEEARLLRTENQQLKKQNNEYIHFTDELHSQLGILHKENTLLKTEDTESLFQTNDVVQANNVVQTSEIVQTNEEDDWSDEF